MVVTIAPYTDRPAAAPSLRYKSSWTDPGPAGARTFFRAGEKRGCGEVVRVNQPRLCGGGPTRRRV